MQDDNWHLKFKVPESAIFGYATNEAIRTGQVTSVARRRIVGIVSKLMLQYTLQPSPQQYTTVCNLLIKKFPKLNDGSGNGIVRP